MAEERKIPGEEGMELVICPGVSLVCTGKNKEGMPLLRVVTDVLLLLKYLGFEDTIDNRRVAARKVKEVLAKRFPGSKSMNLGGL